MNFTCYFCGKQGADPPYVDETGAGWFPTCPRCWEAGAGDHYAFAQREARRKNDEPSKKVVDGEPDIS